MRFYLSHLKLSMKVTGSTGAETEVKGTFGIACLPFALSQIICSGFLSIYTLVGLLLDGIDFELWHAEAQVVVSYVALGEVAFCALTIFWAMYINRVTYKHAIIWISLCNILVAICMRFIVFLTGL